MQVETPSSYDHGNRTKRRIRRTETQKKTMVAISMYRGNLHKVPDVTRRWRMPERNLSFKDFKSLLHRRKLALSRLPLDSNPKMNLTVKSELVTDQENPILPSEGNLSSKKQKVVAVKREEICGNQVREDENDRGFEGARSDGGDLPGGVTESKETDNLPPEAEDAANEKAEANEITEKEPSETEKKRKEVEDRLQVLNAKKHNLVQVLKQILNAEEELKRRNYMQQQGTTAATRPALPLHVDVSNDSGGNAGAQMEGGETDDAANHINAQTRTVLRLCGASSSSESPLRRAAAFSQHNMVPHTSRWSPRVGPSQHGAAVTVSASGTNYIASSPSPAGSGGTSVFRESRLQSPWN
ncbi:hypothetical protein CARUB_v10017530mg [Capsella rubella]|uniref:Uncharacterized protein n=1 Tax=Capsella rubella TaxID=81985 RepID=R0HGK2_9BRAS|nr:uncharacterized protein LOC17887353 [Capsella rubella]EOA24290.1 hypothetical protein CARUB_v10017530mg [Capsella rubella]